MSTAREEIDLQVLAAAFREHRRWAIGITAFFTLLASGVAYILPNIYEVNVVLATAQDNSATSSAISSLSGLASLAGIATSAVKDPTQEYVAVLKSRALISEFVKDKQLLPVLFAKDWDPEAKRWKSDDEGDWPTIDDALTLWENKILTVSVDSFTGLITLTVDWRDRMQAVDWANELIARANLKLRTRAIDDARLRMRYLQDELTRTTSVEIQQSIYRLLENEMNKAMLAQVQTDFAFRIVDPATLPDADNFVRPNRPVLVALGLFLGLILSALVVVHLRSRERARTA